MVKARLRCAGRSDAGRVRRNNEDAYHIDPELGIFLVVDGIGGQAAGEEAARIAIGRVRARLERQTGTAEQRVREAITMANNEILRAASGNKDWAGMACVLTVAVLENGSAVIGHVGDSRLYHVRRGEIRKITHDHSPVGEREDRHELSELDAMHHPRRNEVFRDVGSEEHAPDDAGFIEVERIPFEPDAALLLCSDGLSDQVPSAEIRRAVERNAGHPETAIDELIDAANQAGGKDNVTVVVVEGELFTEPAPRAAGTSGAARRLFTGGAALFIYGLAVTLAGGWFTRGIWVPPPVVITPRVLAVGAGARFPTIAAAMAQARAGDTVEVGGGFYAEQVRLKSGVALRSRIPQEAVLAGAPMGNGPAVLAEDVRGARIAGFWIQLAPPAAAERNGRPAANPAPVSAGIVLVNSDVAVEGVEISGAGTGIEIRGSMSPTLLGNAIRDCTAGGVLITGLSAPWILRNTFKGNKGADLAARDGARPVLAGNVFDRNAVELPDAAAMDVARQHNYFLGAGGTGRKTAPRGAKQ